MKNKYLIAGIFLFLSVGIGTYILGNAYKYKYKSVQTISVTGNAKKDFESDIVKWSASFSRNDYDLKTASAQIKADRNAIEKYLIDQGVKKEEIRFEAVNVFKEDRKSVV